MITIYSKPGCSLCNSAAALCKARGVGYEVKKLDEDYTVEDLRGLTGKERMAMPVVVLDDGTVSDYPGLLSSLKR